METTQNTTLFGNVDKFEHKVILCVVQYSCGVCCSSENINEFCLNCGDRVSIFDKGDIIHEFMAQLGNLPEKFKSIIIIAHNMQKFYGHWILRYIYNNKSSWPITEDSLIMNGTKILQIKLGRYRFIDSLNFFATSLSKLPKMFNLNTTSKGHYPHYFNTAENFNYIGPIPDMKYYDPDAMKPKDRAKMLQWYAEESAKNIVFDNKKELIAYCVQDVTILRLACLKFRAMMLPLTHVDPFNQVTVASTCMRVYKTNFLEENTIPILPQNGYRLRDKQSFKAIKWLEWESHNRNIHIISATNGREVRINEHILVDGYHEATRTVFSFHGCWWHMCEKCFPFQHHTIPSENRMPARVLYDNTLLRAEKIRSLGYNLVEIWEHEFDQMVCDIPEITTYLSTLPHLKSEPLIPRDAFFGGRTGVCKLYHKCSPGEKIHYYDVTSLYPFINKYCEYPVGTPSLLLGDKLQNRDVFNINGIIKCRLIPPRNLFHPVIPIKMDNYLMFVLCHQCGKQRNETECKHTEDERSFTGTYVSNELRVAVEKGYKIVTIFEAWDYKLTKYNPITKSGGLFTGYVNTFLKIKTEASGFPSGVESDEEKDEYIRYFFEKEGILLD